MDDDSETLQFLNDLIKTALKVGADAADAVDFKSTAVSHVQRLGKLEKVERSEVRNLGLRVFLGKKQAVVSTTDWSNSGSTELIGRAISMAKVVPDDENCGLADLDEILVSGIPNLDISDPEEPNSDVLELRARDCEAAARDVAGVTNSEGAEAAWSHSYIATAASNGFSGSYQLTNHSYWVAVLAGTGIGMERDYEFTSATFGADLETPESVGRTAGERAVARLNPRKVHTQQVSVVYAPQVSNGLVRHLADALNGNAIARGTSFLKDGMGTGIFSKSVDIIDDAHLKRGLRSKPFDAEGLGNGLIYLVENGKLKNWVLDLSTARKLGLKSNGRASRSTSSPPSPNTTNLYMKAGNVKVSSLLADIKTGFYVTELMGFGVNNVTGDYSRGASGFWIEDGEILFPVSEVTIAGNLKDMFQNLTPANDLTFKYGIDAPTIRVEGMTVAGN